MASGFNIKMLLLLGIPPKLISKASPNSHHLHQARAGVRSPRDSSRQVWRKDRPKPFEMWEVSTLNLMNCGWNMLKSFFSQLKNGFKMCDMFQNAKLKLGPMCRQQAVLLHVLNNSPKLGEAISKIASNGEAVRCFFFFFFFKFFLMMFDNLCFYQIRTGWLENGSFSFLNSHNSFTKDRMPHGFLLAIQGQE